MYWVGYGKFTENVFDLIVRKYDANGDLDTTWGDGDTGMITYDSNLGDDYGYGITIDSSDNIYVAGSSHNGTDTDFMVRRYDANGDRATDWGDGDTGVVTYSGGNGDDKSQTASSLIPPPTRST